MNHLRGKQPIGVYPLVDDRVWFAAIDLDEHDPEPVLALVRLGKGLGLEPIVEVSKSKGWHLWFFADDDGWPAVLIRGLLHWMTAEVNMAGVEVFPKQDQLAPGGFGNFIYLPLDGRLVPKARTIFVEPTRWLPPVADPWDALAQRRRFSAAEVEAIARSVDIDSRAATQPCVSPSVDDHIHSGQFSEGLQPSHEQQDALSTSRVPSFRGLPPCARRMLEEGVTQQQRVVCFRLAVHLCRVGVPEDLARVLLKAWAKKNRPTNGKRVITDNEIAQQTRDGYCGRYRSYGCEDPMIAQYCDGYCPVLNRVTEVSPKCAATSRRNGTLHG